MILDGSSKIQKTLYTEKQEFVIDSGKLLEKGQLIEIRPHTRFTYFPRHRHNYIEMIYMCSGSTSHIINDTKKVFLREGDLLLMNQNVFHEILPAGEEDIAINFIILPAFFDRAFAMTEDVGILQEFLISTLSSDTSHSNYLHFQTSGVIPIQNLVENMIWAIENPSTFSDTVNQTTMGLLLLNLSSFSDTMNKSDPNQYRQKLVFSVLKYVETHYQTASLEEISKKIKQPTYYISRLLKEETGSNFKELLRQKKLQQAARLLSRTRLPVEAIFEAVGYNNSSYFYRKFLEKYGMTPRTYRLRFAAGKDPTE